MFYSRKLHWQVNSFLLQASLKFSLKCIGVPDLGSRDRDVVLVRRVACWGNPKGGREFGMGRDWGGFGEGEISSRATWGQGGRDRTTQREGFQVSERESE
jgi:hypothetical protein